MRYEIFWKVLGGDPGEKFTGSDIIETKEVIDSDDADSLACSYIQHAFYEHEFPNLGHAINNDCNTVCKNWKIDKIKKLNDVDQKGDE